MSHIHIPDGVLPVWLVLLGWVVTGLILSLCIRKVQGFELGHKLPLLGVISALMIVGMTLEIVPIGYHINMTVIAGIILGPALGFISAFIVDLILAMFGHGGITVVGLNALILGTETVLGFYLFRAFLDIFSESRLSISLVAALATVFSLIISTSLMIGVVYVSQINPESVLHEENQFLSRDSRETFPLETNPRTSAGTKATEHGQDGITGNKINISTFAKTILFLGMFGWILEAAISGLVIRYIFRVRPNLILPIEKLQKLRENARSSLVINR